MNYLDIIIQEVRNHLFPLMVILLLLVAMAITVFLIQNKQLLRTKASGGNSFINLSINPAISRDVILNQNFDVPVMIGTDNLEIVGVDLVINFDKNYLELTDIIPKAEDTPFTRFLPKDNNDNFDKGSVVQKANTTGMIDFSSLSYNSSSNPSGFSGSLLQSNPLAILKFKAKKTGNTSLNVSFNSGSTTDSNLVARTAEDILGHVNNLNISISGSGKSGESVVERLAGDANDDRCVTITDYSIWKEEASHVRSTSCAHWGGGVDVDIEDFNIWYQAWKNSSNSTNCVTPPTNNCLNP